MSSFIDHFEPMKLRNEMVVDPIRRSSALLENTPLQHIQNLCSIEQMQQLVVILYQIHMT